MSGALAVLSRYKGPIKARFLEVVQRSPPVIPLPMEAEAALKLGLQLGRQEGYGEGLVDGTRLGLDAGMEAMDALLSQPVIFGPPGLA